MKNRLIYCVFIASSICWSCSKGSSIDVSYDRDKEIDVSGLIEEFPVEDVFVHDGSFISGSDKYLYIDDYKSVDKVLSVFSMPEGQFIGQFMDFGGGPNEVSASRDFNIVTSSLDRREKIIVMDFIHHRVSTYDVDSALADSSYIARVMKPLDTTVFPTDYIYVNDTLGFARKIMITPGKRRFQQALGKYNLVTGELTDFAPEEHIDENYSTFAVSKEAGKVIEAGANVDLINIYDFDGKLLKSIKGPEYKPKAEGRRIYYDQVKVAGEYIIAAYSGGDWNNEQHGKRIIVFDMEGNHVATLNLGKKIRSLYYHEPSGTLWLSSLRMICSLESLTLPRHSKKTG